MDRLKNVRAWMRKGDGPSRIAAAYVSAACFLIPLVYRNGYFDITQAKALCYGVLTVLFLAAGGAACLRCRRPGLWEEKASGAETAMVAFAWAFLLSCFLSADPAGAVLGERNRYQGAAAILLYTGTFFFLSRRADPGKNFVYWLFGGFSVAAGLGVLNHLGADPLGLIAPLSDFDRGRFVSTVGNINFFGGYICLVLPVCLTLLLTAERRRFRWALGLLGILGLWGGMASKSESTVLGLGAALAVLPFLLRDRPESLRRLPLLLPGLALAMQGFRGLAAAAGGDGFSALTGLLLRQAVSAALAALGVILWLALRRRGPEALRRLVRAYGWCLGAGLLAAALLVLLANTVVPPEKLGALERFLVLDEDWGTDRGEVWRFCLDVYGDYPWWRKLLGGGPGVLARADALRPVFSDARLDSAHNEYLHYLLTAGALGLASYVALLACTARDALRRDGSPLSLALLAGCAGYAAQAAVSIAQPATTPLFFLFLSVLAARRRAAAAAQKTAPEPLEAVLV